MFYLVDKPAGVSSHTAIRDFARAVGVRKIGHAGTLDPFATGLLLVATDADTPLLRYADRATKTYAVRIVLGAFASTDDVTGVLAPGLKPVPDPALIAQAINNLTLITSQVPPVYSAKQVAGERAYALARRGKAVVLAPIPVRVEQIADITMITPSEWSFTCVVSRGTYIRALVRALGKELGCGAYTSALRRTAIGELGLDLVGKPLAATKVLTLPHLLVAQAPELLHGVPRPVVTADGHYALADHANEIIGVVRVTDGWARVERLLGAKLAQ